MNTHVKPRCASVFRSAGRASGWQLCLHEEPFSGLHPYQIALGQRFSDETWPFRRENRLVSAQRMDKINTWRE